LSSTAIRAGSAYVELTIRDKITQGLRSAQAKLSTFANTARMIGTGLGMAAGIGTGVAAAIVGVSKVFADAGSEIHDMSQRTGVATEALSEFKYAAEQSGASLKDVEKAIRFMQKQGISADKFEATLIAVSQIADESQRAATAMKLWGKTGAMLLPMAGEIAQLRAQRGEIGDDLFNRKRRMLEDDLAGTFDKNGPEKRFKQDRNPLAPLTEARFLTSAPGFSADPATRAAQDNAKTTKEAKAIAAQQLVVLQAMERKLQRQTRLGVL